MWDSRNALCSRTANFSFHFARHFSHFAAKVSWRSPIDFSFFFSITHLRKSVYTVCNSMTSVTVVYAFRLFFYNTDGAFRSRELFSRRASIEISIIKNRSAQCFACHIKSYLRNKRVEYKLLTYISMDSLTEIASRNSLHSRALQKNIPSIAL